MKWIVTTMFLFSLQNVFAQSILKQKDTGIDKRIVIIGDAGSLVNGKSPVIDAARNIVEMDKNTIVLFVGDNLYSNGLPDEEDPGFKEAASVLDSQASLVKGTPAHAYFMPGNHDWDNSKPDGYDAILRQSAYVNHISPDNVKFYPEDGCPGPEEIPLGDDAVLIIMDSQWWLEHGEKPGIESDCKYKTQDEVLSGLKDILEHNVQKCFLILNNCLVPVY